MKTITTLSLVALLLVACSGTSADGSGAVEVVVTSTSTSSASATESTESSSTVNCGDSSEWAATVTWDWSGNGSEEDRTYCLPKGSEVAYGLLHDDGTPAEPLARLVNGRLRDLGWFPQIVDGALIDAPVYPYAE